MQLLIKTLLYITVSVISLTAQDTFSIIAADPETGEIGAAGATCVDGIAPVGGIKILNRIIPGRGGVNAQAWICINPHSNLNLAIMQMANGLSPMEIIDHLMINDACSAQNFNPAYRQYGIVDFDENNNVRVAAFTGENADDYKGHIEGENFSIQGNILIGPEVLEEMEAGFKNTSGSIADKLMAAMQGANIPGADARCLDRGTSSTSAFLKVSKADDPLDEPSLLLDILEMPFGEEPIDSLQVLFDEWKSTTSVSPEINIELAIFPNPVDNILNLSIDENIQIKKAVIYNMDGRAIREITKQVIDKEQIDVSLLKSGQYFIQLESAGQLYRTKEFIKP